MSALAYVMSRRVPAEKRCAKCDGTGDADGPMIGGAPPVCPQCKGTGLRQEEPKK
jgi:DnaJ-class molecular chaperone